MKNTSCLQYVINGMNDKLFDFAESEEGKTLIDFYKKYYFVRDNQVRNLLVDYNSYFMVKAVIQARYMPQTEKSVIKFMRSKHYRKLQNELTTTVQQNFQTLMSRLNEEQHKRLFGFFD